MQKGWNNEELLKHINRQMGNFFGEVEGISDYLDEALARTKKCFSMTKNKYYTDDNGEPEFSLYHSGQYSIFLYYLSNTIYKAGRSDKLADKIYYLNKILHSVDWFYAVDLPKYWGVEHPLSSVLGRAEYGDGFFFYQGCTVGGNKGKYPKIGKNVILYSNASVLGDSSIGDNVLVATGTTIKDEDIPSNCLVFGQSPNLIIKLKSEEYLKEILSNFWLNI